MRKISLEISQKIKTRTTISTHYFSPRNIHTQRSPQSTTEIFAPPMFIDSLFTIARKLNQPCCLSTDERKMKIWHIYKTDHYLVLKKNKIIFTGK